MSQANADRNLPNGLPPNYINPAEKLAKMHFNGVDSSHSSRSASPHTNQIPPSQLPPRLPIPPSQLPPNVTALSHSMKHLQVGPNVVQNTPNASPKPNFSTSTPVLSTSNVVPNSGYSPITPTTSAGFNHSALSHFTNIPLTSNGTNSQPNVQNNLPISRSYEQNLHTQKPQQPPVAPYLNQNVPQTQTYTNYSQPRPTNVPNINPAPYLQSSAPKPPISRPRYPQLPPQNPPLQAPSLSQINSNYIQPQNTNLHSNRYPNQQPFIANEPQQNNQPQPYQQIGYQPRPTQMNVTQSGFGKMWGADHVDLLQCPNILPPTKVEPVKVSLGQNYLDAANCSSDVFQSTLTKVPETSSLLQKSRLPLGILIHPFKDLNHLPVIQCNVIVRCRACRTYINPFVFFVDNKRWKCNLCYRVNELPEEFQYDPVSKTYGDPSRRPEIKASTIEYIAPAEYMLRPPQPAVYLYLLDISRMAVESGYLHVVCNTLVSELANIPGDSRTQIGFLGYDSALHFFLLGEGASRPHELIVLEVDDVFLPTPDNLLVNLKDRFELVTELLTQLPTKYADTFDTRSSLGSALQVAHKLMFSTGGRVTVFQASLPTVGPGNLTAREDPTLRNSSEAQHLNPANDFYKRLALECSSQQIAVDLFVVNSQYVDVATISGISRFSGGCIYHFPLFNAARPLQSTALERSIRRYLTRKIGFEAVMRVRCTRGLSIHTFHGNFFVRSTDLLSLPNINPDAGFGMQIAIEESLSDVQTVCFQAALLYTSSKGERRIRVHTLCLPVASTLTDVMNSADQQCIVGLLAKMAADRSMQHSLADAREALVNVAIDILSSYKLSLNMGGPGTGLLMPNCLALLPLYISALLKFVAFRVGISTRLDDRVKSMCDMKTKPLGQLIQQVYPDLYPIHNLESCPTCLNEEEAPVPQPPHLQLTARSIDSNGAYLLDAGEHMIIMVCPTVSVEFLTMGLGVARYEAIPDDMYEIPVLENPCNQRLNCFLNSLNDEKPFVATLQVIREESAVRGAVYERFVEDRIENALSYHEFLQHLKTQVK